MRSAQRHCWALCTHTNFKRKMHTESCSKCLNRSGGEWVEPQRELFALHLLLLPAIKLRPILGMKAGFEPD